MTSASPKELVRGEWGVLMKPPRLACASRDFARLSLYYDEELREVQRSVGSAMLFLDLITRKE
jgi:hypothetical protein